MSGAARSDLSQASRLDEVILAGVAQAGEEIAVEDGQGTVLTHRSLQLLSEGVAKQLRSRGIARDEPVLVGVAGLAHDLVNFLGVWRAGGVVVPVHLDASAMTVRHVCEITGARTVVHSTSAMPRGLAGLFTAGGSCVPGSDIAQRVSVPVGSPVLKDAALVVFTSGTTGAPKGVVQSHRGYCGRLRAIHEVYAMAPGFCTQLYLQLTFSFGQWTSFYTLARGGMVRLRGRYDAEEAIGSLLRRRVDWFPAVPSLLRRLSQAVFQHPEREQVRRQVGLFLAGGEVLRPEDASLVREAFAQTGLTDVYGLTETNSADFIVRPEQMDRQRGSIGHVSPGVLYRIAPMERACDGLALAGELQILTPFVMRGYLGEEALTKAAFDGDYLRTGDLAEQLPDGAVRIVGRVKELINRSGNKVAPVEVEQALLTHPQVRQAMAAGIEDRDKGELIGVMAVCEAGATVDEAELLGWIRARVEKYKVPDILVISDVLPLGATGKRDRKALAELLRTAS